MQNESDYEVPFSILTPIQHAVKNGHINIVNYFVNYFKSNPPSSYSINFKNTQGENCAAIALKNGNYAMFRFIIEKCNGTLEGLDDPIEICLTMSIHKPNKGYLEILMYLIQILHYQVCKNHLYVNHNSSIIRRFLISKLPNCCLKASKIEESFSTNSSL